MALDIAGDRIILIRGEDKSPIIDIRNLKTGRPIDLTGHTKVSITMDKSNRAKLDLTTDFLPASNANALYKGARFKAETAGAIGNDIELEFDGIQTVLEVVNAWNLANAGNQVSYSVAGPSDVLSKGIAIFEGGIETYQPVKVIDALLGIIQVFLTDINTKSLKLGEGQDFTITIDYGKNSAGNRLKGIFRRLDVLES